MLRRFRPFALVILGCVTVLAGCSAPAARPAARDEAGIRATLTQLNTVCAARDLPGFMALFESDAEILFVGSDKGEVFRGPEATQKFMGQLFRLPFVFSFDLKNVLLRQDGDTAWVFVDGNMIQTGDRGSSVGKSRSALYRFSIALVRRDGRWRWTLFHGDTPKAE